MESVKLVEHLASELRSFDHNARNPDSTLVIELAEKTKDRDEAMNLIVKPPARTEEQDILRRLERHLGVTTQQLTSAGKDLMMYRQQLAQQEGEYNCRFGVEPKVAIMRAAVAAGLRKRPASAFVPRRLPRLSDTY
jgi:hypothetical protein